MIKEENRLPYILKEVKLEVTHKCPLSCIHCSSEAEPNAPRAMSLSKALDLAKQISDLGVSEIAISGGEPFLWPGLIDLASACISSPAKLTIYTSGNVDNFCSIFSILKKLGKIRFVFSIFAGQKILHERITRIAGSFQRTIDAIKISIENQFETELHFVPLNINYLELPVIINLSNRLGINRISILRFVPQGRGTNIKDMILSKTQNFHLRKLIIDGQKLIDLRVGSPYNFLMIKDNPKCLASIDRISIGPEYDIYPCDAFKQIKAKDIVGTEKYSIVDRWDLKTCWEKSPYLQVVRDYLRSPFSHPCDSCRSKLTCNSGCLAQKVILNSGFKKDKDPMCMMGKEA